jgi:hypothetical protein
MFAFLAAIYKDPNREENAKREYNTFKILLREDFYLFYIKPNLRYKLNAELYRAIMLSYDSYIDYVALIRLL